MGSIDDNLSGTPGKSQAEAPAKRAERLITVIYISEDSFGAMVYYTTALPVTNPSNSKTRQCRSLIRKTYTSVPRPLDDYYTMEGAVSDLAEMLRQNFAAKYNSQLPSYLEKYITREMQLTGIRLD